MKKILAMTVIGTALMLTGCGKKEGESANGSGTVGVEAPYAGQDWSQTVVKTPDGGFRMGNADAPVKLIEYASLTCPHCRDFTAEAAEPLKEKYVRTGKVSWELRNFVLNPLDLAATMVVRCQSADTFFPFVEQLYATQTEWLDKFNKLDQAQYQAIGALPQDQQRLKLVEASGLDEFFKSHGVPADRIASCATDRAGLDELLKIMDKGKEMQVDGTPAFYINGEKQEGVYNWTGLEAALREHVS